MVTFLVWMVGLSDLAMAQTPPDPTTTEARMAQAKELYKLGAGLYKAGRYKEAIVSFQEAYELSDNKKILYNICCRG
ncbi:MAG: tetratricopeptide repeat protein, partial [Myxococcota bacterium]